MRESVARAGGRVRRGRRPRQGPTWSTSGWPRTDMLYFASGALDVPGAMFTASHNPARYNGIKLCRAGAAPIGADTGLATIREAVEQGVPAPAAGHRPGTSTSSDMLADYAALPARPGRPVDMPAAAGGRRRGQRDGRLHGARGARRAAAGRRRRSTSSWTAPSPTTRRTRWTRRTWSTCRRPWSPRVRTSGWPSTATPTAASSSTSAASRSSPSAITGAGRGPRAGRRRPAATRHPQPDHLARGAGDRHRARRHAGAHPRRPLVHQAGDGRDRRGVRRRALRALLLPRLLARRLRHAGRPARARRARRVGRPAVGADGRLRALRRLR